MSKRSHAAAWCLLCLASLVLSPLWPDAADPSRLDAELADAQEVFGTRLTDTLRAGVHAVGPGNAPDVPGRERADMRVRARLAAPAADLAARLERYAQGLQVHLQRALLKAGVMVLWGLLLAPLLVAAVVDGLVRRAVKVAHAGYQNPAAFALASHALIASLMLPCLVLVAPFGVSPWWMPLWGLLAMLPLNLALGHLQPVFTR